MFDQFAPQPASPLHQSREYESALMRFGHAPLRLADGTLALQRRFGPLRLLMLPRCRPARLDSLQATLRADGLAHLPVILAPEAPAPHWLGRGPVPLMAPDSHAVLPLYPDIARQRAALHQKWRNRLARAERSPLMTTCAPLTGGRAAWLFAADRAQRAARGYRGWPEALTLAYGRANPGKASLFTAQIKGRPVAAMVVLRHGAAASYHIAHTTAEGRAHNAHNLLLWQAITQLARSGCAGFDLGRIDTETAPGLARFKLGTGAVAKPAGGSWIWWPPAGRAPGALSRLDARAMRGAG